MERIKYLDGLKGLCCFMVFLHHFCWVGLAKDLQSINLFSDFFTGTMCVPVFIILSSFGIGISCEKNLIRTGSVQNIILKRYFRIAIPTAIIILLAAIVHFLGIQWNIEAGNLTGSRFLSKLMTNSSLVNLVKEMLLSPVGKCLTWLPQGWMLNFVFLGSFLTIILYLGTEKLKETKLFLVCLFWFLFSFFIDCYYACIVFGFFLFKYTKRENKKYSMSITIVSALLYCVLWYLHYNKIITYDKEVINTILAFFLTTAVFHSGLIQRMLEYKVFLWLGKISFSLYLIHWIVISTVSCNILVHFQSIDGYTLSIVNLLVSTCVLLLVSWMSQKYIEQGIAKTIENKLLSYLVK